ncbi:Uncharacterised protein [Bordetella pertussis]|nr:Uncharacterised protein [Bordetella pertussis]
MATLSARRCCFCLKSSASLQTAGKASPPSVPGPNAAHGSVDSVLKISTLALICAAS